jgi:hypothetical protein
MRRIRIPLWGKYFRKGSRQVIDGDLTRWLDGVAGWSVGWKMKVVEYEFRISSARSTN